MNCVQRLLLVLGEVLKVLVMTDWINLSLANIEKRKSVVGQRNQVLFFASGAVSECCKSLDADCDSSRCCERRALVHCKTYLGCSNRWGLQVPQSKEQIKASCLFLTDE